MLFRSPAQRRHFSPARPALVEGRGDLPGQVLQLRHLPAVQRRGEQFVDVAHVLAGPIVDQKKFFERELGIGLSLEVDTGKYFPKSNDARQVVEAFLSKIKSNNQRYSDFVNVTIINNANVDALDRIDTSTESRNSSWNIRYRRDESSDISKLKYSNNKNLAVQELKCDRLVIASGGLSVINKDGAGIQLLYKLGHRIIPLYPRKR